MEKISGTTEKYLPNLLEKLMQEVNQGAEESSSGSSSKNFCFPGVFPAGCGRFGNTSPFQRPRHCGGGSNNFSPYWNPFMMFGPGNLNKPFCGQKTQDTASSQIPLSHERIKELNVSLASMGFFNEEYNTDLLKRYGGNLERVVEVLVQSS